MPVTWVVGSSGLLGGALRRRLVADGHRVLVHAVPWADTAGSEQALRSGIDALVAAAGPDPWRVAWCAGAGVVGTSPAELDTEVATFSRFLDDLADRAGPGTLFVASSAGGLYAGASGAPFTEAHPVQPLAPYGWAKLEIEQRARAFADRTGSAVLLGRISNLYGPGQNVDKPQGLITQLLRSYLTGQPVSVYVSLDTLRDYLFADDAASMIIDGLDRVAQLVGTPDRIVVKILSSGRSVSVGTLMAEARRVLKRPPLVVLGASPNARFQVRDLRLRSLVWPEMQARTFTTLAAGIAATGEGLLRRALAPH